MTNLNLDAIKKDIKTDDDGVWQALTNLGYDEWKKKKEKDENKGWVIEDMLEFVKGTYGEVVEFAILLGKYSQQVCNGGHSQYFENGYSGTHDNSNCYDYNVPLARRLEELLEQFKLHEKSYGAKVHSIVCDFVNRTYAWKGSASRDMLDEDEDDTVPSYDDLDDSYYLINEWWEHEMKQYFESWLEFGEDPIAKGRF